MNFEFSDDVAAMRDEVRRLLVEQVPVGAVRGIVETGEPFDRSLWSEAGSLGWMGIAVAEEHGGAGLGHEPLCMLAEEIGRAGAAIPFSSSIYLAAEAISMFGSEEQKRAWLPKLASGEVIGALALGEGDGMLSPGHVQSKVVDGKVSGKKLPVWDGEVADLMIIAARDQQGGVGLYLAMAENVACGPLATIEYGRSAVRVTLDNSAVEPLPGARDWAAVQRLLDRAAVLFAFESVGGAQAVLDMAVDYAKQRFAFGRPIASMQAIKHMLADVYVAVELARSNAYYGAWALSHDAPELGLAAATARLAAIEAYEKASMQAIQVHGGMGFTQEVDCHLHYRRAKRLANEIGGRRYWTNLLIERLPAATAA